MSQQFANKVVGSEIGGTWFGFYTKEEIQKLSVKEITNPKSIDELGAHVKDGLYDPALGSFNRNDLCETCGLGEEFCPGHCGHIQLSVPLYHPILFQILYKLLRCVCFGCHQLRVPKTTLKGFIAKMKLLQEGKLVEALNYVSPAEIDFVNKTIGKELLDKTDVNKQPKSKKKKIPNSIDKLVHQDTLLVNAVTEIKNLLGEFFKEMNPRKCAHCKAYNPPLRKDETKLFQQGIPSSFSKMNRALGIDVTVLSGEDVDYLSAMKPKDEQDLLNKENSSKEGNEQEEEQEKGENENDFNMIDSEDSEEEEGKGGSDDKTKKKGIVFKKREIKTNIPVVSMTTVASTNRATQESEKARYITTSEAKQRLIRFFINEREAMECLFKSVFPSIPGCQRRRVDPNMFFLEVLLVPPSRFRPTAKGALGEMEHSQNGYFKQILNFNKALYGAIKGEVDSQSIVNQVVQMQTAVNLLMDSSKGADDTPNGIKQLLEKKQGLFRKNMMGKRVNFAARSVISPDPYLYSNQIGVPEVFAKKLTFEEPVTDWNYKKLAQMVINGPDVHPGANAVMDEHGRKVILKGGDNNIESRRAISKTLLTHNPTNASHLPNKKVFRHLIDDDIVIMNRQPTLHKPSMMTMKTVVQKGERVIRMHYANCKTFNADFDGDEMNMHFPQTQQARADAVHIMFSDKQYITATNGTPLRGLIQDHVVSGVLLTKRDTFFTKDEFQQLFYQSVAKINDNQLVIPPPCILRPRMLWTGKQIITAILKHLTSQFELGLNLDAKAQIGKEMWGGDPFEQMVIIRNSELLTGVLDKAQFGSSTYSLVHSVYELYGPSYAGQLLSTFGRLFTIYLQYCGFTCGIDDLIISEHGNKLRQEKLAGGDYDGLMVAANLSNYNPDKHESVTQALRETLLTDEDFEKLDNMTKEKVNKLTTAVISSMIPNEQMKPFPKNFLSLMTLSGAKGSQVNVSQISCLLGQQELEGRRVPVMFSGKTLPSFPPYDTRVRAGGYVGDRFLTGIRPQEYYFHCMAGREGLVDTAVKTSNSGYLQRCLIKHLEGLYVAYDYSVRDSDGSIVQFRYGEDCIDTMESKYLTKFDFLASNLDTIRVKYDYDTAMESGAYQTRSVENYHKKQKKIEKDFENKKKINEEKSIQAAKINKKIKKEKKEKEENEEGETDVVKKKPSTPSSSSDHIDFEFMTEKEFKKLLNELPPKKEELDPLLNFYNPATHLGCVSETFTKELEQFIAKDPLKIFLENRTPENKKDEYNHNGVRYIEKDLFRKLMYIKYRRSLVHPGEAVGVIVGQSIGEPSTQMTLNTFHLAGHGGANVTLGIPRLREIIMTASEKIKTPSMNLPLQSKCTREEAYEIANRFYRLTLPELLKEITVSETLETTSTGVRIRSYKINLHFQDDEFLEKEHSLLFEDFSDQLARSFSPVLHAAILKEIKTHCADIDSQSATATFFASSGSSTADNDNDNDQYNEKEEEEGVSENLDAEDADQVRKKKQQTSYEDSDEEAEVKSDVRSEPLEILGMHLNDDEDEEEEEFNEYGEPLKKKNAKPAPGSGKETGKAAAGKETGKEAKGKKKRLKVKSTVATSTLSGLKFLKTYKCFNEDNRILLVFNIPVSDKKLLMVSIVERVADSYVVNAIPGIKQCFVAESEGKFAITTLGCNIREIWKYQEDIDINKIYSNDIYAIMKTYGIEAARASIIGEISSVFSAYGIRVDFRHLSLIADYMTFTGTYAACNRTHMDTKASPWTKMSFETTMKFLSEAALAGQYDETKSPSSKIVVGGVVRGGTGYFDILQPLT